MKLRVLCWMGIMLGAGAMHCSSESPVSKNLIPEGPQDAEAIKCKWLTWANEQVARERAKFLALYKLQPSDLNDTGVIIGLKDTHDKMVQEQRGHWFEKNDQVDTHDIEIVQKIAEKIFVGRVCSCIKICNDSTLDENMNVTHNYQADICYITLNVNAHKQKLKRLEELLRHEYSHIKYQDNFHHELIQSFGWANSHDSYAMVLHKSYPFHRAFETRADVLAAIESPDHGRYLIEDLESKPDDPSILTHPLRHKRIALLEQIKAELDALH